jgi:hypothetical protein
MARPESTPGSDVDYYMPATIAVAGAPRLPALLGSRVGPLATPVRHKPHWTPPSQRSQPAQLLASPARSFRIPSLSHAPAPGSHSLLPLSFVLLDTLAHPVFFAAHIPYFSDRILHTHTF